jgi:hypothetical protein
MPPLHPWRITAASYRNDTSWRAINFAPRNIPVRSESADADEGRGTRRDEKREREKKRRCTPRCLIVTIALAATRRGSGGRGEGGGARCIYTVYPHYSRSFAKRQAAREGRALLGALARWHTIPHAFFSPPNPPPNESVVRPAPYGTPPPPPAAADLSHRWRYGRIRLGATGIARFVSPTITRPNKLRAASRAPLLPSLRCSPPSPDPPVSLIPDYEFAAWLSAPVVPVPRIRNFAEWMNPDERCAESQSRARVIQPVESFWRERDASGEAARDARQRWGSSRIMIERESAGKLLVETKREDSEGRIYTYASSAFPSSNRL